MLDHSQVVPSHENDNSRTNVSQLGTLKHMLYLYPRYKQDQLIPLLSRGLGPRPNLDSKPPHLRPGLNMVLRPPPFPPPISRSKKSRNPRQEHNESSRSHKQVWAQDMWVYDLTIIHNNGQSSIDTNRKNSVTKLSSMAVGHNSSHQP